MGTVSIGRRACGQRLLLVVTPLAAACLWVIGSSSVARGGQQPQGLRGEAVPIFATSVQTKMPQLVDATPPEVIVHVTYEVAALGSDGSFYVEFADGDDIISGPDVQQFSYDEQADPIAKCHCNGTNVHRIATLAVKLNANAKGTARLTIHQDNPTGGGGATTERQADATPIDRNGKITIKVE